MSDIAAVKDAVRKLKRSAEALEQTIIRQFPEGADVHWDMRGHRQYGTVVGHSSRGLRVENGTTKKTYWIDIYHVIGYVE